MKIWLNGHQVPEAKNLKKKKKKKMKMESKIDKNGDYFFQFQKIFTFIFRKLFSGYSDFSFKGKKNNQGELYQIQFPVRKMF